MRRYPCLAITVLVLLSLVACSPFGMRSPDVDAAEAEAATATPVPPTPFPDLATPTGTVVRAMATPTPTLTPIPEPTATPETDADVSSADETSDGEMSSSESSGSETSGGETTTGETTAGEATGGEATGGETTGATSEGETASSDGGSTGSATLTTGNVVRNGSFEEGFDAEGIAEEWTAFSSDNGAVFGWEPESEPMHVSHGSHSQLMRIMGPGEPNTFVGIYQTINVVPGETYRLALHGVIRSSLASEDYKPLGFRVQYAIDETGGTDWKTIEWANWTDPGWNDVQLGVKWPPMDVYVIEYTPTTPKITLFVRGWSKWAFFRDEAKFYVDGIFLQGPVPAEGMPSTGGTMIWIPLVGLLAVIGLAIWEVRKQRHKGEQDPEQTI